METSAQDRQLIAAWYRLLAESYDKGELLDWFEQEQNSRGLSIEGRCLCSVLRPFFLSRNQFERLSWVSERLLSAHKKALSAVLSDAKLRSKHFLQFDEWVGRVFSFEADIPVHPTILRFDATFVDGDVQFIELNADMPHAIALSDALQRAFLSFPGLDKFRERFPCDSILVQPRFLDALVREWEVAGHKERPRICFVTCSDDPVRWQDMSLNQEYFTSSGYQAMVADARELEFDGNTLSAKGRSIDVVFRVVSTAESLSRRDDVRALIEADNAQAVLVVNSYRAELMGHKALFAILSDPDTDLHLDEEEQEVVRSNLPWTRLMHEHRTTDPTGQSVDLVPWVKEHKDELVLKPSHDFGAHGVSLGWTCSLAEWENAAQAALESEFIVQQRVPLRREFYPTAEKGMPDAPFFEDIDPFIFAGRFAGILVRLSPTEITNVHSGGSIASPFLLR